MSGSTLQRARDAALIADWREAAKLRDANGMACKGEYNAGSERGYSRALTACADQLEALAHPAADLEADGKWIAASERLPNEHEVVIVSGGIAMWAGGIWWTLTGEQYPGRAISWKVTHWQPLPKLDVAAIDAALSASAGKGDAA